MTSEELAREITETTLNAEVDPGVIFAALQIVFMFWMSCLCVDCRRNVAHKLEADVSKMLENADTAAEHFDHAPTCH
jgi:hypothetical protein